MKNIFIGIILATMLGCSANKSNKMDKAASQKVISGYTKEVTNADLYKFLESNQQNPSLNAVKIKVSDVENILRGYPSDGYVYLTITDTKEDGRTLTAVGTTEKRAIRICHSLRCCPPPVPCHPDFINHIQFVERPLNEQIREQKINRRL